MVPFDLVLMDCQMPEMGGFEATQRFRGELKLQDLPIIAMATNALGEGCERCLQAGMNDYLAKPLKPWVLYDCIDKWLADALQTREEMEKPEDPQGIFDFE